jgi:hypothetical protein
MKIDHRLPLALGALLGLPFLCGADGNGCSRQAASDARADARAVDEAGNDGTSTDDSAILGGDANAGSEAGSGKASWSVDSGGCVSGAGGHCGGNTAHPCTCAPALVCTPGDGGPPFGDVGGTCAPVRDAACVDNVLCIRGSAWDPVLCKCVVLPDAGPACAQPGDCHGLLPQLCMLCDGGPASSCAHWVCRNGACETAICD